MSTRPREDGIEELSQTTFVAEGFDERRDLQRLLKERIEIISPDTMVFAEEFLEWADARRRIDLLGLGSGLIDQSQNMTVAAMQMAEKKVWAQRS
jgi:hypothetical protein